MRTEVGRRVHLVIGRLVGRAPSQLDVIDAVHELWAADSVGGSVAASFRVECSSAVMAYFRNCHPDARWDPIGIEVSLGRVVADVVWRNAAGVIAIDEIKSGRPDPTAGATATQLHKLALAGAQRWGESFAGVRFVPLAATASTEMFHLDPGGALRVTTRPEGM